MRFSTRLGYVGLGLLAGAALAGCSDSAAAPADAGVDAPPLSVDRPAAPSDLGFTSDGNPVTPPPADAPALDAPSGACIPDRALWDSQMRGHMQRQCGTCHGAAPAYGAPFSLMDYDANLIGAVGMRHVDRIAANLVTGRMPAAGTRNRYSHGCQLKNGRESEASPSSKNPPSMKVKKPLSSRKMTMNT